MAAPEIQEHEAIDAKPTSEETQLVDALRALVRREIGRPPQEAAPSAQPSMWEGIRLLILCANIVLLISLLPRDLLSNPALETAAKLLPALFGSLFVIYLAWFRERLLKLTRNRRFNRFQLLLLLVLAFATVPLFRIHPEVLPKGTSLSIDGKPYKKLESIPLSFRSHEVLLQPGREAAGDPRKFRFGVSSLLRAARNSGPSPDWSLLYPADFTARDTNAKVQVKKLRGEYYDDVFEGTDLDKRDDTVLVLSMNGQRARTILLPLGSYELQWLSGKSKTYPACNWEVVENGSKTVSLEEDTGCYIH
jgi:hypothetical protein